MLFNEKLKMLRKGNNLTQELLAEKLNVSRQAITKWESGDGIPDIENLKQISILFNTTIDELVKENKDISLDINKLLLTKELEIDHTKHFDIKINNVNEINIKNNKYETVKIDLLSKTNDDVNDKINIKLDDIYNRLDINIKNKIKSKNIILNIYLPEKYIDEIELNSKSKTLNINDIDFKKLEYDGSLKYLNVNNSKGRTVLNTTKCDIEAIYDKFDGALEINTINSVARVKLPENSEYKTILKGIKNEFINANNNENSKNIIELNGANSKLIIL